MVYYVSDLGTKYLTMTANIQQNNIQFAITFVITTIYRYLFCFIHK